jgi:hypothetical protein
LHATTQELPIGKPYTGAQIDDLLSTLDVLSMMDWYVNLQPHVHKLDALLATVGRHSQFVKLLATRSGETHVQVRQAVPLYCDLIVPWFVSFVRGHHLAWENMTLAARDRPDRAVCWT